MSGEQPAGTQPRPAGPGAPAAGQGRHWAPASFARNVAGVCLTLAMTFLGLTAITFVIGRIMPADPVLAIVGDRAPQDVYDAVYRELGLDRPIPVQYLRYLGQLFQGDLGVSIMTAQPVMDDILRFFPATLELATVATFLGVFAGIPLGVLAAVKQGRWPDHLVRGIRPVRLLGAGVLARHGGAARVSTRVSTGWRGRVASTCSTRTSSIPSPASS